MTQTAIATSTAVEDETPQETSAGRAPGIYLGVSERDYHSDASTLSSTGAKRLLDCPARFRWEQDHPKPYTPAFELGHAVHATVLGVGAELVVVDADSWRTRAAREARDEALAEGLTPLLRSEHEQVLAMRRALAEHPVAGPLFERTDRVCESSVYWEDGPTGVPCRARPDWLSEDHGLIVDLKTTSRSAAPGEFGRLAAQFGYHLQAEWYVEAVQAVTGVEPAFVHVVQETTPPYLVSVVQLDAEALRVGAEQAEMARRTWAECQATGRWPGYAPRIHSAYLPGWYVNNHETVMESMAEEENGAI
ncbi:hypothetical protein GZ998_05395 [Actinomyces sp. 594]|uniref:PD-(D/E)XK nuclease-like domain-containing protein n=1 Tax=Actinomyces sp. 594 TaxID=2057793 RepID=UPI001C57FBB3|nr:PD-(D/E)XK nuclease-like domain-containing protein [Actinomyces sp. 594]MBW3068947.1 hypothetical protein [Actinomyces sp. 594]